MPEKARETILNVDDTESTRYFVTRTLQQEGYAVVEATTAAQARQMALEEHPSLIALDVHLPDGNGVAVCQELKADLRTAEIPVLQLSATFTSDLDVARGLELGADGYLTHPVEPVVLAATVKALLRMRRAEDGLRASAREWSTTFDAISDAVVLVDTRGVIKRCNRAFGELAGRDIDDVPGQPWLAALEQAHGPIILPPKVKSGDFHHPTALEVQIGARWFRLTRDSVYDENRTVTGMVQIFTDITDRKQYEAELISHQKYVEELNRHLQRAMTETHHRVKNNLQIVAGMVELQAEEGASPEASEHLQRLVACVRTLAVVHDILTYEAKDDGQAHSISTETLLAKLMPMIQSSDPRKRVSWEVDDTRFTARQGTSLALIVNELVNNALKHGAMNVDVRLKVDPESAVLAVKDDGPGFPPEFDPEDSSTTGLELVSLLSRWDLGGSATFKNLETGGALVQVKVPLNVSNDPAD